LLNPSLTLIGEIAIILMNKQKLYEPPYFVGGSMPGSEPSYVPRQADRELYDALTLGEFCYVFSPRQTGKSSLLVRTKQRLLAEGIACAELDLMDISSKHLSLEQWYGSIFRNLVRGFGLSDRFNWWNWWRQHSSLAPVKRLSVFIEEIVLKYVKEDLVILVDEIDSAVGLNFSFEYFLRFIRSCYEQRANNKDYRRLTFALFGVATTKDLIRNKKRSPFPFCRQIKLNAFSRDEVEFLTRLLAERFKNQQLAVDEILVWTGGQPFLTQKLCQLIEHTEEPIAPSTDADYMESVVRSQIIENWFARDVPPHLRSIKNRLDQNMRLLKLYQQLLEQGEIPANNSQEQLELIISGLAVEIDSERGSYLRIYNSIYSEVFHESWVKTELTKRRYYTISLPVWLRWQGLAAGAAILVMAAVLGIRSLLPQSCGTDQEWRGSKCKSIHSQPTQTPSPTASSPVLERLSSGERRLLRYKANLDGTNGTKAFKAGKYEEAIAFFSKAVQGDRRDPEVQIYLNNAIALQNSLNNGLTPFTLAVVVPVDGDATSAEEILRGVADAQTEFNHGGGLNGRLLTITIVNDGNDPEVAAEVGAELGQNEAILGVIGHNSANASLAARTAYERAGIAMVSPTTSIQDSADKVADKVFVPILPSAAESIAKLAEYGKQIGIEKIAAFYDFAESSSLEQPLIQHWGNGLVKQINLSDPDPNFNLASEVQALQGEVDAILLLPNPKSISVAIATAVENSKLPSEAKLQLLGNKTLYTPITLTNGGNAVVGMVLAVPWFGENAYGETAAKRWLGRVSWRTGTSYNVTKALIEALSEDATPSTVLNNLKNRLVEGDGLEPILVKAGRGKNTPQGSQFTFLPVEEGEN